MPPLPFAHSHRYHLITPSLTVFGMLINVAAHGETVSIQPTIDILESYVHQTNVASTASFGGETREWVTQISPGLKVNAKGANSLIQGDIKYDIYHYGQSTRPNQSVPTGALRGVTQSREAGLGLELGWSARQEPDQFSANTDSGLVQQGYTTTEWRISPFFEKRLSDRTEAKLRATQTWIQSSQIGVNATARPDSQVTSALASLATRPAPLGYDLSLTHQSTQVQGQSDPVLIQTVGRIKGIYALAQELELGPIVGVESDKVLLDRFNDRVYGWHVLWRPQERTSLSAQTEQRFFGRSWQVDANHRMPWLALNASFSRIASTYASSIGTVSQGGSLTSLFDAMLTTQIPNAEDRAKAVDDLITQKKLASQLNSTRDVYNLSAQLRQNASGRMVIMGRRNTFAVGAGRVDVSPLTSYLATLSAASQIREYFFSTELNHQLTPTSRLIAGMRWNRLHNHTVGQPYLFTRSFSWSTAYSTDLSKHASATIGLRKQIAHSTQTGNSVESAGFAGLGYRF